MHHLKEKKTLYSKVINMVKHFYSFILGPKFIWNLLEQFVTRFHIP